MTDLKAKIQSAVNSFSDGNLLDNAKRLLNVLGYQSELVFRILPNNFDGFANHFLNGQNQFDEQKAKVSDWRTIELIFQISEDEVKHQNSLFKTKAVDNTCIESYLFFVLALKGDKYSRTDLVKITREINHLTPMPSMILFRYDDYLTLAIIDRRLSRREPTKDVLQKVTLIKDINIKIPHRAHIEILYDLSLEELTRSHQVANFVELHHAWQKILDTKELNKRFFQELANWYFWATQRVEFPDDVEKNKEVRNATSVIRLITRLIFVWFLKEKGLVLDDLFDERKLKNLLKYTDLRKSTYYKAILQNLFFATLNTEMGKRRFRTKNDAGRNGHYFIHNVFRYENEFIKPKETLEQYFGPIPFLNGGLFECLDKEIEEKGKLKRIRIDGFSDRDDNILRVPDELFFCDKKTDIDLNQVYGTKNKRYEVRGLIDILNSYKFTIAENTPLEEEVALDPELLGKVFENLLANYNPETQTTARKQTGSFYTPREIVNYMVDESLINHFKQQLSQSDESEEKLRDLLSYSENGNPFSQRETEALINAIDTIKVLDPACGSGAFPMGILHKLVHILHKLDRQNSLWKQKQIEKAGKIDEAEARVAAIEAIEEAFENNELDYGRKLYLIENCIYGVDIQPIAVQIAKLRFFISLIVDQKASPERKNLGIRPLPNLETKFVAANTLIALEKERASLFTNEQINKRKVDLKRVRHDYFEARTPKRKESCRIRDKQLRKGLAELLKKDGWGDKTAKQLAGWDPYDQNASSGFFDSEWMFGVRDGFDVVIGNPPYGAEIPGDQLQLIKAQLEDTNNRNSAAVFIDFAKNKITKRTGILSFIVPKSLLFSEKWLSLAQSLGPKTLALVDVEQAFDNVLLEQAVFVYDRARTREVYTAQKFISERFSRRTCLPVSLLHEFKTWLCDVSQEEIAVARKMMHNAVLFSEVTRTTRGFPLQKVLKDKGAVAVIGGKNVQPYAIDGVKGYINKADLEEVKRRVSVFSRPKIVSQNIVAHIANPTPHLQITSALDLHGTLVGLDTVNNTYATNDKFDLKFLVALLNSRLMSWYAYRFVYAGAIRTMHFDGYYVGKLPAPDVPRSKQSLVISFVERILTAKKKDSMANTTALEREIDEVVYKLYGLTKAEIKIVEGDR